MESWVTLYTGLLIAGISVGIILTGLSIFLAWVAYMDRKKFQQEQMLNVIPIIDGPPHGRTAESAS